MARRSARAAGARAIRSRTRSARSAVLERRKPPEVDSRGSRDHRAGVMQRAAPRVDQGRPARACDAGYSAERRAVRRGARSSRLPDTGMSVRTRLGDSPRDRARGRWHPRPVEPDVAVRQLSPRASPRVPRDLGNRAACIDEANRSRERRKRSDAIAAITGLGWKRESASAAVDAVLEGGEEMTIEALVREALRRCR